MYSRAGGRMGIRRLLTCGSAVAISIAAATIPLGSTSTTLVADSAKCDLSQYKAASGLTASVDQDALLVTWAGEAGQETRARFTIDGGTPTIADLAVRKGGQWLSVGQHLTPEYHVVSGIRRLSVQQAQPL